MNNPPIVVIGGGGHASVLVDILLKQKREIIAVISPDNIRSRRVFDGIAHFKENEDIQQFSVDEILLVNGVGMLPGSSLRHSINEYYLSLGYRFSSVIADEAVISPYSVIKEGAQVLPNAIINAGALIGMHTIINTGALVEHDCIIGDYNHIAPRATLCGQVYTQDHVFVGANATVIQNVQIEAGAVIRAGSLISKDVIKNQCFF